MYANYKNSHTIQIEFSSDEKLLAPDGKKYIPCRQECGSLLTAPLEMISDCCKTCLLYEAMLEIVNDTTDVTKMEYSGRGMVGVQSRLAFAIDIHPSSVMGLAIIGLGFTYDNLGRDYVYYLR